jgi:hypothetical protein
LFTGIRKEEKEENTALQDDIFCARINGKKERRRREHG